MLYIYHVDTPDSWYGYAHSTSAVVIAESVDAVFTLIEPETKDSWPARSDIWITQIGTADPHESARVVCVDYYEA